MTASGHQGNRGGKAAHFEPLTKALEVAHDMRQQRDPDSTAPILVLEDEAYKALSQTGPPQQHSWASLLKGDRATS